MIAAQCLCISDLTGLRVSSVFPVVRVARREPAQDLVGECHGSIACPCSPLPQGVAVDLERPIVKVANLDQFDLIPAGELATDTACSSHDQLHVSNLTHARKFHMSDDQIRDAWAKCGHCGAEFEGADSCVQQAMWTHQCRPQQRPHGGIVQRYNLMEPDLGRSSE